MTEDNQTDLSKIQNPIVRRALRRRCGGDFIFNHSDTMNKHSDPQGHSEYKYKDRHHSDHQDGEHSDYDDSKKYDVYVDWGNDPGWR